MGNKKFRSIDFEKLLQASASLPFVHIDRAEFLRNELKKYCDDYTIELAVKNNPAYAKIPAQVIDKIADGCIKYETLKVSTLSFTAGLPGGLTMFAAVPADLAQYYAHVLRVIQKLAYLYGWENLINKKGKMDDETSQLLTLFTGVMFGVKGATTVVTKISQSMAEKVGQSLAGKALTNGVIYPIVKKVAQVLGFKISKEIFAKGVSKLIPILGGAVSGGITFASFRPMSRRFKDYLSGLDIAKAEYYENNNVNNKEYIDVDFSDIDIDDIK
jgi:hypothetical protein